MNELGDCICENYIEKQTQNKSQNALFNLLSGNNIIWVILILLLLLFCNNTNKGS